MERQDAPGTGPCLDMAPAVAGHKAPEPIATAWAQFHSRRQKLRCGLQTTSVLERQPQQQAEVWILSVGQQHVSHLWTLCKVLADASTLGPSLMLEMRLEAIGREKRPDPRPWADFLSQVGLSATCLANGSNWDGNTPPDFLCRAPPWGI
jgi:hypothetical protein